MLNPLFVFQRRFASQECIRVLASEGVRISLSDELMPPVIWSWLRDVLGTPAGHARLLLVDNLPLSWDPESVDFCIQHQIIVLNLKGRLPALHEVMVSPFEKASAKISPFLEYATATQAVMFNTAYQVERTADSHLKCCMAAWWNEYLARIL
ncbi:hypothetical protein CISG_10363 [Coccidioides immitis RMSCC 3703]|uniref:Uncharacterized protein n=1 Tax=Coccidioides immitis RMSCC 3703 TaxID=454286 RepID=A0A0J8QRB4_COCIT|nr:hypothetical protein CISG_10363 [Coccidioides immitis RMSCC 3703]